jgi:hypothetical protein
MKNGLVEYPNGTKAWFQSGQLHRLDGPAYEWADGSKAWYQNGKRHRLDGPAVEYADGTKRWYQNGKRHRLDGPAIEWADGTKEWYQNGKQLSEEEVADILLRKEIDEVVHEMVADLTDSIISVCFNKERS